MWSLLEPLSQSVSHSPEFSSHFAYLFYFLFNIGIIYFLHVLSAFCQSLLPSGMLHMNLEFICSIPIWHGVVTLDYYYCHYYNYMAWNDLRRFIVFQENKL